MSDNEKPRVYLGQRATEVASKHANPGDKVTGKDLEKAIEELLVAAHKPSETPSIDATLIRAEADQLYRELATEMRTHTNHFDGRFELLEIQLKSIAGSLDAIRVMLNIFGEELGGADTSELFKEANQLMENVLEPLARGAKERVLSQTRSDEDTRGSQRDEDEEVQSLEDPDLEMNGHTIVMDDNPKEPYRSTDSGRRA